MSTSHDVWSHLFLKQHRVSLPALAAPSAAEITPRLALWGLEAELAELGFALSGELQQRLAAGPVSVLKSLRKRMLGALKEELGAAFEHEPLFRRFPKVPSNTAELRWRRLLVHYLQSEEQACLFCGKVGHTQVLDPCGHVVCSHCWDPADYNGCPICGVKIDPNAPYFKELPLAVRRRQDDKALPAKRQFIRLELCEDQDAAARQYFERICARTQPLSPSDREGLGAILREYGDQIMGWLPDEIPLRENVAAVFGTLAQGGNAVKAFSRGKEMMSSATDVLRFIAAMSGADPALIPQRGLRVVFRSVDGKLEVEGADAASAATALAIEKRRSAYERIRRGARQRINLHEERIGTEKVYRFTVAKLPRVFRRAVLAHLDGFAADSLTEDMLRHRSYWKWVGQFLHPHEYAERFPFVCRAFQILRSKAPDGSAAPRFFSFNSKLEGCLSRGDVHSALLMLKGRPGQLARRADHLLRLSAGDEALEDAVLSAFSAKLSAMATPVLVTLLFHLSQRGPREGEAPPRVFWPKAMLSLGVWAPETRGPLPARVVRVATEALQAELLRRFGQLPQFSAAILDRELSTILAPFNPRMEAKAAVALPRGSSIQLDPGARCRLFLHWCEPAGGLTDLDLSLAFYNRQWAYSGVCSYYQLTFDDDQGRRLATHSGDFTSAPAPDGATEFVDIDRAAALQAGARYAVMVVNAYAGLPFSSLDRGFAGLMVDGDKGRHFDPRAVRLKFELAGESGVYMPLVFDLQRGTVHWLDVHRRGQFEMNNVETSKYAIRNVAPTLMSYFQSGVRASVYQLGLLHLAARAQVVYLRGAQELLAFARGDEESVGEFYERLCANVEDERLDALPVGDQAQLAILFDGDLSLPADSQVYALFAGQCSSNFDLSDLVL